MKLKVCCNDRMCFYIDAITRKPLGCSFYDAWCFSDPEPNSIHISEW